MCHLCGSRLASEEANTSELTILIILQVSIVALKDGQIVVVQSSMLGSILSNLLLVMGMCFLFGGLVHRGTNGDGREQSFSAAVAQTTCSLMTLSSASLVIPAAVSSILRQSWYLFKALCC